MLEQLIEKGEQELVYFESVLDTLSRADTESELALIRQELIDGGYLKRKKGGKQRLPKEAPPYSFTTSEGFKVLVGRNNVQNDKLTLKTAKNYDVWLHTQNFAGSHTILLSENREITDLAISEAAQIAAFFSSAREAQKVPVDYTRIKNIRHPDFPRVMYGKSGCFFDSNRFYKNYSSRVEARTSFSRNSREIHQTAAIATRV